MCGEELVHHAALRSIEDLDSFIAGAENNTMLNNS
jgi:hypothetical protein